MTELLICLVLLQAKHLVCDWVLQPKWMWANKGTYGHFGGICHALFNGLGTALIISSFYGNFLIVLLIDSLLHYHIDFAKMNILKSLELKPEKDPAFWWLTGADQYLHQCTYLIILLCITLKT